MRVSLLAALLSTALFPMTANAQDHSHRGHHGDRGSHVARADRPARSDARPAAAPRLQGRVSAGVDAPRRAARPAQRVDARRFAQDRATGTWAHRDRDGDRDRSQARRERAGGWERDHRDDRSGRWNRNDHAERDHRWDRSQADWRDHGRDHDRFDRRWRDNHRYDWRDYRGRHRSAFRLPRYYAPHGGAYGYRRFSIGFRLDSLLFGSDYWIADPYEYRLPPAYGPYRWVRYYDDALLVDVRTGAVVDVVYDIFW